MKILYLWDTAGVFSPVAKWLNENGHEAKIVMRTDFDPFGQTAALKENAVMVEGRARNFYTESARQIRSFKPDLIHVSGSLTLLTLARAVSWRAMIVMSFHGTDIRYLETPPEVKLAEVVHVTTQDLSQYGVWIDRPIDSMFYYRGGRVPNTAVMMYADFYYADKRELAREWCEERGIELTVINRSDPDFIPIPNAQMPEYLSTFEYFLDWKDQKGDIYALSKTALEALACGCLVSHDENPDEYINPETFRNTHPSDYLDLYNTLEKPSVWKALKRLPRVAWYLGKWMIRRVKKRYGR